MNNELEQVRLKLMSVLDFLTDANISVQEKKNKLSLCRQITDTSLVYIRTYLVEVVTLQKGLLEYGKTQKL